MKQQTNTRRRGKKAAIAAAAVILAAGVGSAYYIRTNVYADSEQQTNYREYDVSKGNITVGISESGTVSVGRSYTSFPVSAEIEEVYVKTGSKVKNGDKIAKLNTDDIDKIKSQYEKKISDAESELNTAIADRTTKLAEARKTYDTSINEAGSAEDVYGLSLEKIQNDISDAGKNIENLKKQLNEYEKLLETYPDDYKKYSEYESKYEEYSDTYEEYCDIYGDYEKVLKEYEKELTALNDEYNEYIDSVSEDQSKIKELKENVDKTKEAYEAAVEKYDSAQQEANDAAHQDSVSDNGASSETSTAQKNLKSASTEKDKAYNAYTEAEAEYKKYISLEKTLEMHIENHELKISKQQDKIDEYKEMMEKYSEMMSDFQKEMNKYKTEFDDYKSDFTDIYGNLDEEDVKDKIESLKSEIENAEYNLENLEVNKSGSEFSALQKKQDAEFAAQNADTVYSQTVAKLDKDIADKQEEYDTLCQEYSELTENMGDGVYLYADCDGQVASVNVSEGDTIMENQIVATLTDSSEIYVSAAVSESDISSLSVGQETQIVFSAYENMTFEGEIDTIAVEPARSSGSVSYTVTVKVQADGYDIREGMTADITFLQKQAANVLYTNINAITFRDGVSYVTVYDENRNAVEKQVTTGFSDGRYVEITSGVSAGDKVLAEIALSENNRRS